MMTYRIVYREAPVVPEVVNPRRVPAWTEEFPTEHQALGRARELIEAGEHHGVAVHDSTGNVLCGVPLQLKLGGFSGD